ncbi:MAG: aspartate--tRNA ligase [Candidatus Krumholzibacteriota bacterium]|nr:aspartate--tRNA ligase [Candidatus Krumholzibacteriota bacterium]
MTDQIIYHIAPRWKRTRYCGELRPSDGGERVVLAGWVKKVREFGDLTFLDLWDRSGLVQAVVDAKRPGLMELFRSLRAEDVVAVAGTVVRRPAEMVNPQMATGEVEIAVEEAEVFNRSKTPPFNVSDKAKAGDDLRLRYRYLDLRRDSMQRNIRLRHDLAMNVRRFLAGDGFLEIETPMLVRRTPEGARDYLVPSRLQPGRFYALPQSPQLYKQILMVSGFDRYFQLARCLRDEDLRADRQPEHTQIDIEMSFVDEEDVFAVVERMMAGIFGELAGVRLDAPFRRIDYDEAMARYGTDKPDLRFGLEIVDVSDLFASSGFNVFREAVRTGGVVRGIVLEEGLSFSKSRIRKFEELVRRQGAGGLATVSAGPDGIDSSIAKFLSPEETGTLAERFGVGPARPGLVMLVGGPADTTAAALGALRSALGAEYRLQDAADAFSFVWINRFPLLLPAEGGGWEPAHHIFSIPLEEDLPLLDGDPGRVRGHLYDLVCNGVELGSGSIRVHHRALQEKLFALIGLDRETAEHRFGFLLEAFEHGAPPHGGIALGVDRIAMILGGESSIRDFIAFPKTQKATSLMEGAPSTVERSLLDDLHIRVIERSDGE